MGNSPSKSKKGSQPLFTRTDTSGSAKSGRSIRSRRSNKESIYSNDGQGSFKTATDYNSSPILSRKSSSKSVSKLADEPLEQQQPAELPELQDNLELPPSMIQIPPREPILIRANSDGNMDVLASNELNISTTTPGISIPSGGFSSGMSSGSAMGSVTGLGSGNTPVTPTNSSFRSISNYGTPVSSIDINDNSFENKTNNETNDQTSKSPLVLSRVPTNSLQQNVPLVSPLLLLLSEINIEDIIQRLLDAGYSGKRTKNVCLKNSEIAIICATAREIFLSQPPLLELSPPVKIVGDVHGQFNDLIRIFTKCGFPPLSNYLFLGDYVDRGKQSLETILLLLCYKIKYPENFFLLRGNHECASVTRVYGFLDECKRRCNTKTWKCFIDTFNTLPILATVASKIFCVHGGLSPVLSSMDEIRRIQRPTDIPDFGLLNDLVWSDPADTVNEWEDNERGVSYCFNKIAINKFLNKFQFDLVVRAHMVVEDGYEFFNERSLVTVFSAPNYCGEFDNWGAVMSVNEELLCSFELLDPLDSAALKQVMKKGRMERSLYM